MSAANASFTPPAARENRLHIPRREWLTAWLMIAPALLGFILFYAWPALRAVEISFTE